MRNNILNNLTLLIILLTGTIVSKGQENSNKTKNPFPLTEVKKEEILKECQNIIQHYSDRFGTKPLDQWPKAERDSFLITKAKKINILFAPNYYREYNTFPSIEEMRAPAQDKVYPGELSYRVTFHTDTLKEKLVSSRLFYADIWNTGEAKNFTVPVYNGGIFFRPPLWEDGEYQDWKTQDPPPYAYITGYEGWPKETLEQRFRRLQKEKQAEIDRKKNKK